MPLNFFLLLTYIYIILIYYNLLLNPLKGNQSFGIFDGLEIQCHNLLYCCPQIMVNVLEIWLLM